MALSSFSLETGSLSEYSLPPSETDVEFPARAAHDVDELSVHTALSFDALNEEGIEKVVTLEKNLENLGNLLHQCNTTTNLTTHHDEDTISLYTASSSAYGASSEEGDEMSSEEVAHLEQQLDTLQNLLHEGVAVEDDGNHMVSLEQLANVGNAADIPSMFEMDGEVIWNGNDDMIQMYTPSDTEESETSSSIDGTNRVERVTRKLEVIQELLHEARVSNDAAEAAWANVPMEEPQMLITQLVRSIIRMPFAYAKYTFFGILKFNLMLLRIPLIPFYILRSTFYGLANVLLPLVEIEHELEVEDTQRDSDNETLDGYDGCSTEMNGLSEYNQSLAGNNDNDLEELFAGPRTFRDSPHPRRFFADHLPNLDLNDVPDIDFEQYRTFCEPPTRVLDAPERENVDIGNPPLLYDLQERQGNE